MANAQMKTTDNTTPEQESLSFSADVSRLLEIVAHALYSNRDVFLRELISNAADACDRLRYEAIKNPELTQDNPDFRIRVFKDTDQRIVTIKDNGTGMTREEIVDNLGTIARSGTAALMEQVKASGNDKEKMSLIGQFGVGFYASFMVANKVEVISSKAGADEVWHWESDGRTGFAVRPATTEEAALLDGARGTVIQVHIDDQSSEFLIDEKLKEVILTYSDHIDIPIFLGQPGENKAEKQEDGKEGDAEEKPVNQASALWTRSKDDISEEEYTHFYQHIGHGYDEPLMTSHWKAEGLIEFNALLFIPTMRPWDLYDPTRRHAVRLYVKRVFITDDCEGLVYPWLRFMRGVIDSKDLPLNISREMLQHNPVINKIRTTTARRILGDMDKLSRDDEAAYATFWGQFGAVLKEGLYDAAELRTELLKVVRFYSTNKPGELTSLADYVERMPEEQKEIYYISGENLETLQNSPQLEGFKERGLEVLFFTDTIDDFWLQSVPDYKGKAFKSVTKGNIDLSGFNGGKDETDDKDTQDKTPQADDAGLTALMALFSKELVEEVGEIRISSRLSHSPVCLVAADNEVDLRMERVLRIHQKYEPNAKRVLEINPTHPLIARLGQMAEDSVETETVKEAAHLLLDQARIIQGEPVPDPAAFAQRMARSMTRGITLSPSDTAEAAE